MICVLDAVSGPQLILGGSVVLLAVALGVLAIATVVLMFVRLQCHLAEKRETEKLQASEEKSEEES